jgi:peptidyl-Asp metalloendopeptidase
MTMIRAFGLAYAGIVKCGIPALALALSATFAMADGLLVPVDAADVRAAAAKGSSLGQLVARSRLVRIDQTELARHVAPLGMDAARGRVNRAAALDGVVTLELFSDVAATFRRTDIDSAGDSGYSWTGEIGGDPVSFAAMIVGNGQVTGHVQLLHRLFRIEPLGNGVHRVSELIPSRFPREYSVRRKRAGTAWTPPAPRHVEPQAGKTTIRILMVYTAAALAENPNLRNDIKLAITLANVAHHRSRTRIKFERARTISARSYVEAGPGPAGFVEDLDNLGGENGNILKFVRNKRDLFGADLVSLFRTNDSGICGLGYFTDTPGPVYKDFAFSVVTGACIPNYSFHHEAGHNMGLRHDWYVEPEAGFVYNHGYVNKAGACRVRTVMAYNDQCSDLGFSCTRINYFSTQRFKVDVGGTLCRIGRAKGMSKAADNAQRLKEVRNKVRDYRP